MSSIFDFKLYFAVSLCLAFIFLNNVDAQEVVPFIVGGSAATQATSRFLVSIHRNNSFICGGSLVTLQHVATAARCIKGVAPRQLTVRGGSALRNQGGIRRAVVRNAIPSAFNMNTNNMDVGILKLKAPMTAPAAIIPLFTGVPNIRSIAQVYGWGRTNSTNAALPTQARRVNLPLISRLRCKTLLNATRTINDNMMCVTTTTAQGVCVGDAGGPVVCNGRLCGIISMDTGCNSGGPVAFTRVAAPNVSRFINNQIQV